MTLILFAIKTQETSEGCCILSAKIVSEQQHQCCAQDEFAASARVDLDELVVVVVVAVARPYPANLI